jgi:LPS O-antigen subunit length determinant protein (WzzB/FepE family)
MAKDPAFLFYPGDWLGGTMTFSRAHKGAYMDLLMCQFNQGHMALQDIQIILGEKDYVDMWENKLKAKFTLDLEGKYYNEKLENETVKRKKYTDSRRKNLNNTELHMESHMDNHKVSHMDDHMENENGNINKSNNGAKTKNTKLSGNFAAQREQVLLDRVAEGLRSAEQSGGENP